MNIKIAYLNPWTTIDPLYIELGPLPSIRKEQNKVTPTKQLARADIKRYKTPVIWNFTSMKSDIRGPDKRQWKKSIQYTTITKPDKSPLDYLRGQYNT
jgi:hypothetical protein